MERAWGERRGLKILCKSGDGSKAAPSPAGWEQVPPKECAQVIQMVMHGLSD